VKFARVLGVLAATATASLATVALGVGPAVAVEPENCKTVTRDMVRPDSGVAGTWATDTFKRVVTVCVVPPAAVQAAVVPVTSATFKITGKDVGTFKTQGVKSPMGATMLPAVDGNFDGVWDATYVAPYLPATKEWPGFSPGGTNADDTSTWISKLWTSDVEHKGELTKWTWTYTTCNEKWVNGSGGNSGDITGLSTKNLDKCLTAKVKVLCDGKAEVTVVNKLGATITVTVNGKEYQVAKGTHVLPLVLADGENEIKVKYGRQWLAKVKCIKPTACPVVTTPPVVVPTTTPAATPSTSPTTVPPAAGPGPGTGALAVTGTKGNPVPMLVALGTGTFLAGAALLIGLVLWNRRKAGMELATDAPNDTIQFTRLD
jgi:hypothetical protein